MGPTYVSALAREAGGGRAHTQACVGPNDVTRPREINAYQRRDATLGDLCAPTTLGDQV